MKQFLLILCGSLFFSTAFAAGIGSSNPADISFFIQSHGPFLYLSVFFALGVLLAFTPCVLPMVPILSGIITGQHEKGSKRAFKLSLAYVMGMAITYAVAGMLASWFGATVQTLMQRPAVILTFSLIFVLMALWLLGLFELRLPAFLQISQRNSRAKNHGVFSSFLMGVLSTLVVSPCVTAPLIGILTYIAQSGQVLKGGLLLFVLALGMGVPLLLVGAGYGKFLPKTGIWMERIKQIFAVMMLAMAVWLAGRILTEFWLALAWSAMLFSAALILGIRRSETNSFALWMKAVAILCVMASGGMLFKANLTQYSLPQHENPEVFVSVNTQSDLRKQLAKATKNHKAVFVEFFADWCSDCQAMDKKVFNQPEVLSRMKPFVNIRVDISKNTKETVAIKSAYGIYGIPTLIFFNDSGRPLENLTSVGQISKADTLALLEKFKAN